MQLVDPNNSPDKRRTAVLSFVVQFVRFYRKTAVKFKSFGRIKFGRNSYIGKRSDIFVPNSAVIGDNVSIASDFFS